MRKVRNYLIPHSENDFKPLLFTEASLLTLGLIAILLFASSAATSLSVKHSPGLAEVYASVLVDLTNKDRSELNLPTLVKNPLLEQAASMKAADMSVKSYFAHTSPEGITPWHWLSTVGYNFLYAGENLAEGFQESTDVNSGWLNSPTHKANIVSSYFTEIGIATASGVYQGIPTTFVVQYFGQPQPIKAPVPAVKSLSVILPPKNPPPALPASRVLGEAIKEPVPVIVLAENTSFIGAENTSVLVVSTAVPVPNKPQVAYSTWYDRLLMNEPYIVGIIFTVLSIIVFVSLLLFVSIEFKIHHRRYALFGLGLMGFLMLLIILNHSLILLPGPIF